MRTNQKTNRESIDDLISHDLLIIKALQRRYRQTGQESDAGREPGRSGHVSSGYPCVCFRYADNLGVDVSRNHGETALNQITPGLALRSMPSF